MIPRWVYVDGRYRPYGEAAIHVEDRGFQFADSVYEVCAIRAGHILDLAPHLDRLERSLAALDIKMPMARRSLDAVIEETIRRNGVADGLVYVQISRGVSERDHAFPDPSVRPTVVVLARPVDIAALDSKATQGIAVVTMPDNRWARRDIKTTGLLGNVLGKQAAKAAGGGEVWFLDDKGRVTEGGSTNAWIVDADGRLRTRALSSQILAGVTRASLLEIGAGPGLTLEEKAFSLSEALQAREAFSTSAVALLMPVVRIDGATIGDGKPGPVAKRLRQSYLEYVAKR